MANDLGGLPQDLEALREPKGVYRFVEAWMEGTAKALQEVMRKYGWELEREWFLPDHADKPFRKEVLHPIQPQSCLVVEFKAPKGVQLFLNKIIVTPADTTTAKWMSITLVRDNLKTSTPPSFQTATEESGEGGTISVNESFTWQKMLISPGKNLTFRVCNKAAVAVILVKMMVEGWQVALKRAPE